MVYPDDKLRGFREERGTIGRNKEVNEDTYSMTRLSGRRDAKESGP